MKTLILTATCCFHFTAANAETTIDIPTACVVIDRDDELTEAGRKAARTTLQRVLELQDVLVVESDCTKTYSLAHRRLAENKLVISLRGPKSARRYTGATTDEMLAVYRKLAHAVLVAEQATATAPPTGPAPPSTGELGPDLPAPLPATFPAQPANGYATQPSQPTPNGAVQDVNPAIPAPRVLSGFAELPATGSTLLPQPSRSVWHGRLGVGAIGADAGTGAAWALGFRTDRRRVALDFSVGGVNGGTGGSIAFKTLVLGISDQHSFYGGGGFGIAGVETPMGSGGGLQVELAGGIDVSRTASGRWFVQGDVSLPLFNTAGGGYPATIGLALGYGR